MTKRPRSTYKNYLRTDDPFQQVPKTTKWRLKQRATNGCQPSSENEPIATTPFPPDVQECLNLKDVTDETNTLQNSNECHSTTSVSNADIGDEGLTWYDCSENIENNWFREVDEESVWYDVEAEQNIDQDVIKEETIKEDEGDKPIYCGASITVAQSAILILSFALRHNITGECLSDLLTLIAFHCLDANGIHKSLYRFRAFFSDLKAPLQFHKYCSKCEYLFGDENVTCPVCNCNLNNKDNVSYFVEIPLIFQIQQLFLRRQFHQNLMHRFHRTKKNGQHIEDIYDGLLYKKYSKPGCFLSNTNNISFMWYTDGVPLFKSSKISIWPLFLSINELPFTDRMKQENMIFAGLWFGKSKPSMATFLKPFHNSLKDFRENGITVECVHCSKNILVHGLLLCGTCDLPAKCMVMNMTQFNGKYGCPRCKQPGTVVKRGKGHTRVFPFNPVLVDGPKRNHDEFLKHGEEAFAKTEPVFGVKGPSWWGSISADIINGTAIDYMHSV